MSKLITTGSELSLLRPGLKAVITDMHLYPLQCFEFNKKQMSDKAVEFSTEMKSLGLASFKPEGAPIATDGMQQMFTNQAVNRTVAVQFKITQEALADNLYKEQFPRGALALRNSLMQFKNIQGVSFLNNGYNSSHPIYDGVSLFSPAHPLAGGTSANTFAISTGLNETSLEDALIGIQLFLNAAGLKISVKAEKLIIPPQLQFTAERLLGSKYRTGTANNDINAIYATGMLPKGYAVNQFLSDPTQWTIITDCDEGFIYYERQAVMTDVVTDPETNNLTCKAWERYSFTNNNWRSCFGSRAI